MIFPVWNLGFQLHKTNYKVASKSALEAVPKPIKTLCENTQHTTVLSLVEAAIALPYWRWHDRYKCICLRSGRRSTFVTSRCHVESTEATSFSINTISPHSLTRRNPCSHHQWHTAPDTCDSSLKMHKDVVPLQSKRSACKRNNFAIILPFNDHLQCWQIWVSSCFVTHAFIPWRSVLTWQNIFHIRVVTSKKD